MEEVVLQSVTMARVIERARGFASSACPAGLPRGTRRGGDFYEVVEVRPNAIILRCIMEAGLVRIEAVGPMSEHLRDPGSTGAASVKSSLPRLLRF